MNKYNHNMRLCWSNWSNHIRTWGSNFFSFWEFWFNMKTITWGYCIFATTSGLSLSYYLDHSIYHDKWSLTICRYIITFTWGNEDLILIILSHSLEGMNILYWSFYHIRLKEWRSLCCNLRLSTSFFNTTIWSKFSKRVYRVCSNMPISFISKHRSRYMSIFEALTISSHFFFSSFRCTT